MTIFKSDNTFIYLDTPYCEFYIPMFYFSDKYGFAEDYGNTIRGLGLFNIGIFKDGKIDSIKTLNLPAWITMYVYESEETLIQLPHESEPIMCKVLKYYEGSKIMDSSIIQDSSNSEIFLKLITSGKLPKTIPYSQANNIWRKNLELNNTPLRVPSVILEMILSVAYRSAKDLSVKFAKIIGSDTEVSEFDYKMSSIQEICQYASTFIALTFQDFDAMVTTSINRSMTKGNEAETPIEQIIKM